ncbi:microtubule-associated tumor suppressor 1 homolog A isoform X1 [Oreochromis aureus]|uniref:Microtubule associated tumor suppressor 1b n=1 Tax=Oreochromis aureus TaxID=47969 RepID=A0A668V9P9_OREAU|nr:microtubule-associated tumor suppressor 1 homolog A isoform X1 [Oreochromis aureus]XP_031607274.1 microtubule-associated tumor suppressor 1 homolog A isoform X1 [Oreochromis aureus]XP_039471599.1 microtubule-associated tumor suppressor 1 homolog A isoform X1 [Oreochromis aureus]
MASDQPESMVPPPHSDIKLILSSETHPSTSVSPDSSSSISYMNVRGASSSADINVLEHRLSQGSPVDNLYNTTLTHGDVFFGVTPNLNQTFIATPVNDGINFWKQNLSLMSNEDVEAFIRHRGDESNNTVMSQSSCGASWRGSNENDCCSLSSGEMVMRSNSFCLEDQSLLLVSSLEESSISPAACRPESPAVLNLLSTTTLDVCNKPAERVPEENTGHPCLGATFIQADNKELLDEDNEMATSNCFVALPNGNERGLFTTFICETSPDYGKEANCTRAEAEPLPPFSAAFTPEQGKTFVSTLSNTQEIDEGVCTSTPVQNIENQINDLLSSSFIRNVSSPGLHPVKQQQISVTNKQCLDPGLPPTARKAKKIEMKRFPKPDFSHVKSKVITRDPQQSSMPGTVSQHRQSEVNLGNKRTESLRRTPNGTFPAKRKSSTTSDSATSKIFNDGQLEVDAGAANLGLTVTQSCEHTAVDGQGKSRETPAGQCSKPSSQTEGPSSSQVSKTSAQHACSQSSFSSLEKSPGKSGPKPTPKKGVSNKAVARSGSSLGRDKSSVFKTWPRCSSESSSSTSRTPKEKQTTLKFSPSFYITKADTHQRQTKAKNLSCSSKNKQAVQTEDVNGPTQNSSREVKKISLVAETARAHLDDGKTRCVPWQPSPRLARRTPLSQPPPASPRPTNLSARQRLGSLGMNEFRIPKAVGKPQSKQTSITGCQRAQAIGEPSLGSASAANIKPQVNGLQPPQTPTQPSVIGPRSTPVSKLPHRTLGPSRSLTQTSVQHALSQSSGNTQVSGGVAHKATPFKSVVPKARLISTSGKNTGPTLSTVNKPAASTGKGASNSIIGPLLKTASAKLARSTLVGSVDKNKSKAGSHQQHPQQQASQQNQSNRPQDAVPASLTEVDRINQNVQQLKGLLRASNCRFEALSIVLQQTLTGRDEATQQCRELSQELVNLREELVSSVHSSERLEKENEELHVALEDALHKLQEQHRNDLAELEKRLQAYYQAERDKVHCAYQEEADQSKTVMQQQIEELKANHEAMKLDLEKSHEEQLQCVKQQYEMSLEELRKVHNQELEALDKTLKDAEASLSSQIDELTSENNALNERLTAEERKRKELAENSQKDPHTLYLEQELQSLKVVLDIKNAQLHQQEKKLMEIDKLTEKNVKLDESLKKVQQENEDLKARMEKHAALSRQLSTEQAMLQESLHKESKVNKRLSMENEELLWKLHNGDLSSPRKVSPTSTSPSHSFNFQSPRSSGCFSSPPLSPR